LAQHRWNTQQFTPQRRALMRRLIRVELIIDS
jgi:hypothetical protein